jgi:uncharacterized protein YciI
MLLPLCLLLASVASEPAPPPVPADLYFVVFLRPDPARKAIDKTERERIQNAHMANIMQMAKDGILVSAGPFDDQPATISGIFFFRAASIEKAREIAARDPTVVEHRNTVDVHAWRGPEGMGAEYFRLHKEHPETPENMGIQPLVISHYETAWQGTAEQTAAILAAHGKYMQGLRHDGKLGAAGMFEGDSDLGGMVIFQRIPMEEARSLVAADPAVKAGFLRPELHVWWSAEHVLPW